MKQCRKCGRNLPLNEYYEHAQMLDGHLNICKECTKKRVGEHRRLNAGKIRQYDRQRGNRLSAEDYQEYRVARPDRYKATNAVNNAIRDGRLEKKPCLICGRTDVVHGHHSDYSKPLEVIWLCPVHHAKFDGRTKHL